MQNEILLFALKGAYDCGRDFGETDRPTYGTAAYVGPFGRAAEIGITDERLRSVFTTGYLETVES